jgi:hypothetical protein
LVHWLDFHAELVFEFLASRPQFSWLSLNPYLQSLVSSFHHFILSFLLFFSLSSHISHDFNYNRQWSVINNVIERIQHNTRFVFFWFLSQMVHDDPNGDILTTEVLLALLLLLLLYIIWEENPSS